MRAPRLRPAAWWLGYAALVLLGAVVVIGPSHLAFRGAFMAWHPPVDGPTSPGDHLQMSYFLWLWHDGLRRGHLPWSDVYQFAATGHLTRQPFGWPLVVVTLPVSLLFGPVAAYNILVLAAFVLCAVLTAALVRALGLSRPAAAVAGVAFAFAPYRMVQATSHVNALLAPLLPLVLLCVEKALADEPGRRRWAWGAAAAEVSLVASGELHLAVFSVGMMAVYLLARWPLVRAAWRELVAPAAALVAGSALAAAALWAAVLHPSVASGGRALDEAASNAPRLANLTTRTGPYAWPLFERYAYPGLVIAGLALVGAVIAARRRAWLVGGLAALIGGCAYLAFIPGLEGHPGVQRSYRVIPFLGYTRVPGRALLVAALALAVLAALAVEAVRSPRLRAAGAAVAAVAILIDAPPHLFARNPAPGHALPGVSSGDRLLELPPFDPGHFSGSVYNLGIMQAPGPRVGGYSPFVTPEAHAAQAMAAALAKAPVDPCAWRDAARRWRLDRVAVHRALFGAERLLWPGDGAELVRQMDAAAGLTRVGEQADVVVYRVDAAGFDC